MNMGIIGEKKFNKAFENKFNIAFEDKLKNV